MKSKKAVGGEFLATIIAFIAITLILFFFLLASIVVKQVDNKNTGTQFETYVGLNAYSASFAQYYNLRWSFIDEGYERFKLAWEYVYA